MFVLEQQRLTVTVCMFLCVCKCISSVWCACVAHLTLCLCADWILHTALLHSGLGELQYLLFQALIEFCLPFLNSDMKCWPCWWDFKMFDRFMAFHSFCVRFGFSSYQVLVVLRHVSPSSQTFPVSYQRPPPVGAAGQDLGEDRKRKRRRGGKTDWLVSSLGWHGDIKIGACANKKETMLSFPEIWSLWQNGRINCIEVYLFPAQTDLITFPYFLSSVTFPPHCPSFLFTSLNDFISPRSYHQHDSHTCRLKCRHFDWQPDCWLMSHWPTNCCPATEHRKASVCLRNPQLLHFSNTGSKLVWVLGVWMDNSALYSSLKVMCCLSRLGLVSRLKAAP